MRKADAFSLPAGSAILSAILILKRREVTCMNKKEILEIRRQFTPENCSITRICGCYVDYEKEKKAQMSKTFLTLPEEEAFKYFDIFRHTLSGTFGKHLLSVDFPLESELSGEAYQLLCQLRTSRLEDEELVHSFFDKVIENYVFAENYYITLIHAVYDVPGKSSDGSQMFDASDNVYEHILCSICPVKLTKPGLTYNAETDLIEERIRDWFVEAPVGGFLFPAFSDRLCDMHHALYYTKKSEELQPVFIQNVLGGNVPLSAMDQKTSFQALVSDTLGDACHYEAIRNIHESIQEMLEESKDAPEPLELSRSDVKKLLAQEGASEESLRTFEEEFDQMAGESRTLLASNIAGTKHFQVETSVVSVKVPADRSDLISVREIDGRNCLVIPVEDYLEVNGMPAPVFKNSLE